MKNKNLTTGYIAAVTRGHNGGVCLLKDGEIVFTIEEERLSRMKYDGTPIAAMKKILEYTDKIDYLVVGHTSLLRNDSSPRADYTNEDIYTATARKWGLIDPEYKGLDHPQVVDLADQHHKLHAACAFYRSGFETATAVVVDGAGTLFPLKLEQIRYDDIGWETETVIECEYPATFKTHYKHIGTKGPLSTIRTRAGDDDNPDGYEVIISETAGITKVYEAVTDYLGFSTIEAGKTMGLFPYGEPNDKIPPLFEENDMYLRSNRNVIIPAYPMGAFVNSSMWESLNESLDEVLLEDERPDFTKLKSRRDLAYACQIETQNAVVDLIRKAVKMTGNKNVVLSGGYGLNCVANYHYLKALKDEGINLYVEPISNDGGTAIGAALLFYRALSQDETRFTRQDSVYLGPEYSYSDKDIDAVAEKYNGTVTEATHDTLVDLITNKNIVSVFQGRSENGPRALGNRSLVFDPTFEDGKDFVNKIKRREYFRPFAGSILEEDVHEWFDLRGMESSPTMMYAVNCQPGVEEKIPAIIHVDGTCRIQTVNREQNPHYYDIIKTFKERTGVPIVFNTSFNLGGEPLVETLDDACRTLAESEIEYLYLPEYGKMIAIEN